MNTVRIPAKKVMEPDMSLNDIDNIWDYIDMYVEEEMPNMYEVCLDNEDDFDDGYYNSDDYWDDYDGRPYMSDKDWDYYDAFEGEPEAVWGREW